MSALSRVKKVRSGRVSETQIKAMIDFMEGNKSLATGKFPGMNGRDTLRQKWDELGSYLNTMKGAQKNSAQWQVTWRDLKSKTSMKIRNIRNARAMTGNKEVNEEEISSLDERIIGLIGSSYVEGSSECPDSIPEEQELIDRLVAADDTVLAEPPVVYSVFSQNSEETNVVCEATADVASTSNQIPGRSAEKRAAAVPASTRAKRLCNREKLSTQLQNSKQEFLEISKTHANAMTTMAEAMKVLAESSLIAAKAAEQQAAAAVQQAQTEKLRTEVFQKLTNVLEQFLPQYCDM
ncbi:uncharacterized protein LOC125502118 [Athalia rosae]|uniref:uncharacterized protein LOC125502118 n=1 Tax=Athalia rosae TaxID=37344 RepID=UPI002033C66B|nr:uncharacterized protein LOC125502118 [Athalia rosae]